MNDAAGLSVVAIIPTRTGSKGLPNKNLIPVNGRPMLEYSIKAAQAAQSISRVIVSTDGDEIEACARAAGATVFRHPTELSTDDARTFPVIQWTLKHLCQSSQRPDLVAVMRATTPFRTGEDIDAAVRLLADNPTADSVVSLVELPGGHPKRLKQLDKMGRVVDAFQPEGFFPVRRQEVETVYVRNGGIYLARPEVIEAGGLWGAHCLGYVMPPERSLNVNSRYDYQLADLLARSISTRE